MQVELFISCLIDQFYPTVGWNMVKVLEKLGCTVHYNPNQTCCGMPAYFKGHRDSTKEVATKFLEDFNSNNIVVSPSPMCTNMVVNSYDRFFKNTSNHNIYRSLQQRIFELSDFLKNHLKVESLPSTFNKKVAFHHNCNCVNYLDKKEESIKLLEMVNGCEIVHTEIPGLCCGYSGDYAANHEDKAVEKAKSLIKLYEESGAEVIVSNDQHCLFHYQSIKGLDTSMEFMHLADVLAQGF